MTTTEGNAGEFAHWRAERDSGGIVWLRIDKSEHPWLQAAAIRYWNLLHDTVEACQPPDVTEGDVLRRCAIVWGVVYGTARLAALDQIPAAVPGDAGEHIGLALTALYAGWHAAR